MPRQSDRNQPQVDYSRASKNFRSFRDQSRIIPQGIITDPQQNVHNVEHIIKYLQSNAFRSMIETMIQGAIDNLPKNEAGETIINNENTFDASSILNDIRNIWNWINNYTPPVIPDIPPYAVPGDGKLTLMVNGNPIGSFTANQATDDDVNIELTEGNDLGDNLVSNTPFYLYFDNSPGSRTYNILIPDNVRFLIPYGNVQSNFNLVFGTDLNNRDFYVVNRLNVSIAIQSANREFVIASTPYNLSGNTQGHGLRYVFSDGYSTNTLETFSFYGPGRPSWTPEPSVTVTNTGQIIYH